VNLNFRVVKNVEEAKKYWEFFSPHQSLDDLWEFRYTWFKFLDLSLHFLVGFDRDKPIGLLPLQKNTLKGLAPRLLGMDQPFLEFFGGVDTDDNGVYLVTGYEEAAKEFLTQIKEPAVLTSLKDPLKLGSNEAVFYLDRFAVNLDGATSFDSWVDKHLSGKVRKNVKHELRRNKMEGFKVEVQEGNEEDLQLLYNFSIARFGERSSFNLEYRRKVFEEFFKLFQADIFKIVLNGETKAVVFGIVHNRIYTGLNAGYDYSVPNLGKFMFTTSVEQAVKLGCKIYDAGQGDNNWKTRLHITQIPQYKLTLNL